MHSNASRSSGLFGLSACLHLMSRNRFARDASRLPVRVTGCLHLTLNTDEAMASTLLSIAFVLW